MLSFNYLSSFSLFSVFFLIIIITFDEVWNYLAVCSELKRGCHLCKEKGSLEMGFTKWVWSKNDQEHKDLKRYWGWWVKGCWEA